MELTGPQLFVPAQISESGDIFHVDSNESEMVTQKRRKAVFLSCQLNSEPMVLEIS